MSLAIAKLAQLLEISFLVSGRSLLPRKHTMCRILFRTWRGLFEPYPNKLVRYFLMRFIDRLRRGHLEE